MWQKLDVGSYGNNKEKAQAKQKPILWEKKEERKEAFTNERIERDEPHLFGWGWRCLSCVQMDGGLPVVDGERG